MNLTQEKVIKIESVLKYISEDLGKAVEVTSLDYEGGKIKVITESGVNPVIAKYDEEEGMIILDDLGNDILNEEVYCILFSDDFIDSEMTEISLEGAKSGILVLMHLEPLDNNSYEELLSYSK